MPGEVSAEGFAWGGRFILVEFRSGGLAYSKREDGWALWAQPTVLKFSGERRSCRGESFSSNCSCVGALCAAALVLLEQIWGAANIRPQTDSALGTAPPACRPGAVRGALGRPVIPLESRSVVSDTAWSESGSCNRWPLAAFRHG